MGTYTTNYNLFMPTIGEQGWGDLVNGNFTTIDITMKGLDTRLTAVESEVNGNLSCTSVTTSGTITSTGVINANGGIIGVLYVQGVVGTSGDEDYATLAIQTLTLTADVQSFACNNYDISYTIPKIHCAGVYTRASDLTGTLNPSVSTRKLTVTMYNHSSSTSPTDTTYVYYKTSTDANYTRIQQSLTMPPHTSKTLLSLDVPVGTTYQFYLTNFFSSFPVIATYDGGTTYKVKYAT